MRQKHTQITFTRIYAVFVILLCILTAFVEFPSADSYQRYIDCFLVILSAFLLIFYINFPRKYYSLVIPHFIFFFQNIFKGSTQAAAIMFFAAVILLFAHGFFRVKAKQKIMALAGILLFAILTQFRFSLVKPFITLLFFIFLILFFLMVSSLIYKNVKNLLPENMDIFIPELKTVLDLNEYNFTERELFIIKALQRHKTYAEISKILVCSESVVKKTALEVFAQFNTKNQAQFLSYINQFTIKFPPLKKNR